MKKKKNNCIICGEEFYYFRNKGKYCSKKCKRIRDNNKRKKIKDRPKFIFCINCNKNIEVKKIGVIPQFCSNICRNEYNYYRNTQKKINYQMDYYDKHKEEIIKNNGIRNKEWRKNNRKHFNELMKKSKEKNKDKCSSRDTTKDLITLKGKKRVEIDKKCKVCGSIEKLQIHHEIYPTNREDVKKAINEGKIYFVCLTHHKEIERGKKLLCKTQ